MRKFNCVNHWLVLLCICCFSITAVAQNNKISQEELEQIGSKPTLQGKIDVAEDFLSRAESTSEKMDVLNRLSHERREGLDADQFANYFMSVAEKESDPMVKAEAIRHAGIVMRYVFRYPESRQYFEEAYEKHPERDLDERTRKGKLYYEIVEDDWFAGRWEKGLAGFVDYATLYYDTDVHNQQLYAFFEAIPTLVLKVQEHVPESTVIQDQLNSLTETNNPGALFAAAMIQLTLGEYDAAKKLSEDAQSLSDDSRWFMYHTYLLASIDFLGKNWDEGLAKLDELSEDTQFDYYTARYVRIFGMSINLFYPEQYDMSYPLYQWFLDSPLYTQQERLETISEGIVAHIRLNYAIDLTYKDRRDDSLSILEDVFTKYYGSDEGNYAGLIVAEHYINHNNLERADEIMSMIFEVAQYDRDIAPRANFVMAKLREKQGREFEATSHLNIVHDLPDRPGDTDITRAQYDAMRH